jgi:type I restriction enzyme, S subunit
MVKSFLLKNTEMRFGSRLVPSFYYYTNIIKKENIRKNVNYTVMHKIADVSDGEHSHISRINDGGVRYLYGRNIKEGVINFDPISDTSYISNSDYKHFTRCHISQNDILIAIYGTIGKSAIYKKEYVGVAGIPRHVANITLKEDSPLTAEFIVAYFRSILGKWQLNSTTTGNMQQLLSLKNIRQLDLPIPGEDFIDEITEQEKCALNHEILAQSLIADAKKYFYNQLDINFDAIEKEQTFTVKKEALANSDMWTPKYSSPLYLNTLAAIREKYPTVTLDVVVDFKKGDEVGSVNYNEYIYKKPTDVQFIRTSDIINHEVDLYPDYFIPWDVYKDLDQDIQAGDILFAKDGKVGMTGMLLKDDNVIIASGLTRLRLKQEAKERYHLTPEYIFLALSIKETGQYPAIRRTVIASTIPHLREQRLSEIEIPIIDKEDIDHITNLIKKAFSNKNSRKNIIKKVASQIDDYLS